MAFTIGAWAKAKTGPFSVGIIANPNVVPPQINSHFELADQAATTSPVMQTPWGIAMARIVGRQKGWGSGNGTVGPTYALEVAFDSGFTSQRRVITQWTALRTPTYAGIDQTFVQEAYVPDAQTYTFARVVVALSGTDVVTADFMLDFLPGA